MLRKVLGPVVQSVACEIWGSEQRCSENLIWDVTAYRLATSYQRFLRIVMKYFKNKLLLVPEAEK